MTNKYFGTDGIRGTVNQGNITGEKFFKFGLAAATYFKNQKKTKQIAIIAKDTRLSGYTLEPALVSGLEFDKKSFDLINLKKIPFILHHMQGTPETMQKDPKYNDALLDIYDFFEKKINFCLKKKSKKEFIILDPGIGFGKNLDHNLRIMSKISTFHS